MRIQMLILGFKGLNPSNLIAPSELPDTYLCELTLADAVGQRLSSIDKL